MIQRVLFSFTLMIGALVAAAASDTAFQIDENGIVSLERGGQVIQQPKISVTKDRASDEIVIDAFLTGFNVGTETHEGDAYAVVTWPYSGVTESIGHPNLPVLRRFLVIPMGVDYTYQVEALGTGQVDLDSYGLPQQVAPRQAPIEKVPGAREAASFDMDADAYSAPRAAQTPWLRLSEYGICRGHRMLMVEVIPIHFDPTAGSLEASYQVKARIQLHGTPRQATTVKPLLSDALVLNPPEIRQAGTGNYLIVTAEAFVADLNGFIAAKTAQGNVVTTQSIAPGTSNTAIKAGITALWGTANAPDYILLVGDTDTIPHWIGGGTGTPATDLPYACMDAGDDWIPDIPIGRFPARNQTQLQAMIDKTLMVENSPNLYFLDKAVFMAGDDNHDITEGTHEYVITTHLDPLSFTIDRVYEVTYGATTADITASFNDGRIYGIYSGHGGTYSWADGPPFSQDNVNALTNEDMYSFVCSFACITGTFTVDECFIETWIRAADKGAAAAIGSSVNSYWDEDDILERRLFDAIYDDELREVSPAWQQGMAYTVAHFGQNGTTRRYSEMYNMMGDPNLAIPPIGGFSDMAVTPGGALVATGPSSGPFSPTEIVYTVKNTATDASFDFTAAADQTWVDVNPAGGTLAAGATQDVTVSINNQALTLGAGHFEANVNFTNTTTGDGDTVRIVSLDSLAEMQVTPTGTQSSEGPNGGPFVPAQHTYTVENISTTENFDFAVDADVNWLDIAPSSGTLNTGESETITVTINAQASYLGNGLQKATLSFTNSTSGEGDADRSFNLTVGVPIPIYQFMMDTDPGWTMDQGWAFGQPAGLGGGSYGDPDPTAGYTGDNVVGYNIDTGDYENSINPPRYLTTTAIDCSELTKVHLKFWRWLGVEDNQWDHALVEISTDGSTWEEIWANGTDDLSDGAWVHQSFDISSIADEQPTLYVRWAMGTTDGSIVYCGWNLDDVEIWGVEPSQVVDPCPMDLNDDGTMDATDRGMVWGSWGETGLHPADVDHDGCVSILDSMILEENYGDCPEP